MIINEYSLAEHQFRFAAWCASTAARSSPKCRFKVEDGVKILKKSSLHSILLSRDSFYLDKEFDLWHRKTRNEIISLSDELFHDNKSIQFTHGVSAKLINCFLKSIFLMENEKNIETQDCFLNKIHPPIDRLLMHDLLASNDERIMKHAKIWKVVIKKGWSSLSSCEYENIISAIKEVTNGKLWKIEFYWRGFQ